MLFQFLIGRLETANCEYGVSIQHGFQFLIGRLETKVNVYTLPARESFNSS